MLKKMLAAAICITAFSGTSFAGNYVGGIASIAMDPALGAFLFIQVLTPAQYTNVPSCSTNTFNFVVSLATPVGQQTMALLMAARAANAPVTITGSGTCSLYGNSETFQSLTY